jgi:chorismate synthase
MNSFGRIFRVHIFGESHGESVGISIDGVPAGLSLTVEDFLEDIERRKGGTQKGTTPRQESDLPIFKSGIFNGKTTGAPLTILFENNNTRSSDYAKQRAVPRPGHADFVASKKFGGFEDYRGGGHFSGRLTVCLVAAGVVAKRLLISVSSPQVEKSASAQEHSIVDTTAAQGSALVPKYSVYTPVQYELAKRMRKNHIEAEDLLWQQLRNNQLNVKFRRQHPIDAYITDFVSLQDRLIVEVNGGYHENEEQKQYDENRTKVLEEIGFNIIRFTNEEVINDIPAVLNKIKQELQNSKRIQKEFGSSNIPLSTRGEGIGVRASILEIGGETDLEKGLQKAIDAKDSIGGIVECRVSNLPLGLGEPFFDSAESLLAHAVFAIPAVRGVEFGTGFAAARMFGSEHNDAIEDASGKTRTNHAGGIVGGITNGNELVFRIAIKPTSSTPKEQQTLNRETNAVEPFSVKGRHDLCIALRVPVVLEAVTAMVLTDLMMLEQRIPRILS